MPPIAEDLLRALAPQVLGAIVRRYGHLDTAEDAVQEALLAAATQWPRDGVPDNPRAWLVTVASRRLTDLLRSEGARRRREDDLARSTPVADRVVPAAEPEPGDADDTLVLMFMCCHPALSVASQVALCLRAVGGLTTGEIARAFLVPEATMTRRITRAKATIQDSGVPFRMPFGRERDERLAAVLHVLYLVFNEGYASSTGPGLQRVELATEAIRLTRMVHRQLPDHGEVTGLLALQLLTDARRAARTASNGEPVPMDVQDRRCWDAALIKEGVGLVTAAGPVEVAGQYQLQAAIAAAHDVAATAQDTDWWRIRALYERLLALSDNPVVALNHVVAIARTDGPAAALDRLAVLEADERISDDRRLHAVRAHLLEETGALAAAADAYRVAAARTTSLPRQRYLNAQADRLDVLDGR